MDNFDEISINSDELYAKIDYYLPQDIKTQIYNDHFQKKHKRDDVPINANELYNKIDYYLPQDIKTQIYNDHFHIKHKCDKLLKWWNDNSALKCCSSEVEDLTNEILENKEGVEYLKQHTPHFEHVYKEHFIDNLHPQKGFSLMNKTQSLITSVSFYMWH